MTGSDGVDGLRVSVLGSLEVSRHGVGLNVGTGMRRAVFGLLALHPNRGLHREAIIDALWGDAPPATAVNQVQAHISKLRRILDPARSDRDSASPLESLGTSYLLRLTATQLDLLTFLDLAERAQAAHSRGELAAACDHYEEALALWRGNPLVELDVLRGHPAVTGLTGQRAALVVAYSEAAFGVGLYGHVLPHLRRLADQEPLNEKAHAQLMIALAGDGQQAAALQVFEALRRRLDDQLGVYPGAELSGAHERVLRQDLPRPADGGSGPDGAAPEELGTGEEVASPTGLPQAETEQAAGPRVPVCQLPLALTDFTGRAADTASLTRLLTPVPGRIGVPVAVLSGPPGVGKTALALQVAHLIRHEFPDGQLHVELAGASTLPRDPADILGELLRALGLHGLAIPSPVAERAGLFRSHLAGRRILVMADDARSADQVRPLLPGTAGCAVLVTSRSRLGGLAGAHLHHLDPLPHPDAVEMLGRIVGPQRVAAEAEASDRLVTACGRLPLAVRIAGAKLATRPAWPVRQIVDAVADQRRRLDELALDDLAFRASVMPSYQALDAQARRAFRRLGLLWPADVAEWVVGALLGGPDAADMVNQLVDKSLLMPVGTDATGEPRYRLHDLLRDYAVEQLEDGEQARDREGALDRALTGWLEIAAAADQRLPRVPAIPRPAAPSPMIVAPETVARLAADPVSWFTAERLNLMASVRQACATGRYQLAARLAAHQAAFQFFQARLDDAEQLWHAVIAAAQSAGDDLAAAHAQLYLVQFMAERGQNAAALAVLRRCERVFEDRGEEETLALVLQWRAYCAEEQGQLPQAQQLVERGRELTRRVGDRHGELSCLRVLGQIMTRLGDHEAGLAAGERAVDLARELHEPYAEYETLHTLANASNIAGRHTAAVRLCLQARETAQTLSYEVGEAYVLGSLGDAYHGLGRDREAIDALSQAQQIFRDRGIQRGDALCLFKIARAYQAVGDFEEAVHRLKASLPAFRALRLADYEQQALRALEECERGD